MVLYHTPKLQSNCNGIGVDIFLVFNNSRKMFQVVMLSQIIESIEPSPLQNTDVHPLTL